MMLSDNDIKDRLKRNDEKRIVITPLLDEEQICSSSVDLRLGTDFIVIRRIRHPNINPADELWEVEARVEEYVERVHVSYGDFFVLHPHEFILASTLEYIKVPIDLTARLEGRSSWGRLGLQIHVTAGFVDPGYSGTLTYELTNVGRVPLNLHPGVRIAQLTFIKVGDKKPPSSGYKERPWQKYFGDTLPSFSRIYKDKEYEFFRRLNKKQCTRCGKIYSYRVWVLSLLWI